MVSVSKTNLGFGGSTSVSGVTVLIRLVLLAGAVMAVRDEGLINKPPIDPAMVCDFCFSSVPDSDFSILISLPVISYLSLSIKQMKTYKSSKRQFLPILSISLQ